MHDAVGAQRLLAEDASAREDALDVMRSYLVQAPAGSGKTELLVQRYLALLARVDEPEHIVALTFTRKAAGEMRERVAKALRDAAGADGREPAEMHAKITYRLAQAALAQDQRRGWAIAEHVSRLSMSTFDALATSLAKRAPLSASLGPHGDYVDDATPLYRLAAEAVISRARGDEPQWRTLLVHLDNNADRCAALIADLLQRRDQLLRTIGGAPVATLRALIETALATEILAVLRSAKALMPFGVDASLRECAAIAQSFFASRQVDGEVAQAAALVRDGIPDATVEALPRWRALARFVLRDGRSLLKAPGETHGFENIGKGMGSDVRRRNKAAMTDVCATLGRVDGLAEALGACARLPNPSLGDESWRIVESVMRIVQDAVAELATVFASEGRYDFVQGNLAALDALGQEDAPSDLLLRLDTKVQHLLVDEFQDTSLVQLMMLKLLTAGWEHGDGRTLFAVGDPMQSIYRFREAEVRFFLEAQNFGSIGHVPVRSLQLRRNFRSQAHLVDWVNGRFASVLGARSDPLRSVVAFESAVASRPALPTVHPTLDLCASPAEEARAVVEHVKAAVAADGGSVAILVRARNHLAQIVPALRAEGIDFTAVELDRLSERRAVIDLLALTYALTQPNDRASWLAVLRAPWCGLSLADLFAIVAATGDERDAPLLPTLANPEALQGVSEEGRERLQRTLDVLMPAVLARGAAGIVERVQGAWFALGGPACIDDRIDLDAASVFFDVLGEHALGGDIADRRSLEAALDEIRAAPGVTGQGVQVMTMHKAKGLEFDTVILPGLGSASTPPDSPLLRWRVVESGLLMAPGHARGGDIEPVYTYLGSIDKEAESAELGRLLYVACTRARRRLHLVAVATTKVDAEAGEVAWRAPMKTSALAKLWRVLAGELPPPPLPEPPAASAPAEPPPLIRVPRGYEPTFDDPGLHLAVPLVERNLTPPFDWARETTRTLGTLAHRLLAKVADEGVAVWPRARIDGLASRVRADLLGAGFSADEIPAATSKVLSVVHRTLGDEKGRWLFDPRHDDARSEWALSGVDAGEIVRIVVDRTFIADGERWIVDFKTGSHEGGDATAFLDSEVERYRETMQRYGRMLAGLEKRKVRLALYYPLVEGGFREISSAPAKPVPTPPSGTQLGLF